MDFAHVPGYQIQAVRTLGLADDLAPADGEQVLSYEMAAAMAKAMLDGPAPLPGRLTVKSAMAAYIERQRNRGKPVGDLISRTNAHILPSLGHYVVSELTNQRLEKWLAELAAMAAMKRSGAKQQFKAKPTTEEQMTASAGPAPTECRQCSRAHSTVHS